jgi:hypothetical protein
MKKLITLLMVVASFIFFSSAVFAAEGEGTIDMNTTYSLVMSAYSSRYKVKVNANYPVSSSYIKCGIAPVAGLWTRDGDYIALKEYSK